MDLDNIPGIRRIPDIPRAGLVRRPRAKPRLTRVPKELGHITALGREDRLGPLARLTQWPLLVVAALSPTIAIVATNAAPAASPDSTRARLEQTERDRDAALAAQKSAAARAEAAATLAGQLAHAREETLARLHAAERATSSAADRMATLQREQKEAEDRLMQRAREMRPLLPLIERLSLHPTETLLAMPLPPEQAIRGVMVMRGIAEEIAEEAAALRREQAALRTATDAVAAQAPRLAAAEAAQATAAAVLDQQMQTANESRAQAQDDAAKAGQRVADLAAQAATLRGLLDKLEQERRTEEARARADAARATRKRNAAKLADAKRREAAFSEPPASDASPAAKRSHGRLLIPVAGTVIHDWGDPTDAGPAMGISYRTAPAARVVAPCGGRVLFAAPFRSYGRLLILDCGGGTDAVLAGFDRLDVSVGQVVGRGDPVGVLPGSLAAASGSRPVLYVELRRGGEPVNPAGLMTAASSRADRG